MANPIVMPRLGDFMTEGTISKWNKAAGEGVEQGEVICEIESEKLNYQLEAGGAGISTPSPARATWSRRRHHRLPAGRGRGPSGG